MVRFSGGTSIGAAGLEGCSGGDAFNFTVRSVDGTWTREATVNGDETNGAAAWFTACRFTAKTRPNSTFVECCLDTFAL